MVCEALAADRRDTSLASGKLAIRSVTKSPECGPQTTVFALHDLRMHEDCFLKLDVGRPTSLSVRVTFKATPSLAQAGVVRARATVYATFSETASPVQYRYQETVEEPCSGQTTPIYDWGRVEGTVFFCVLPSASLETLTLECATGVDVPRSLDLCQIWRIAGMVTPDAADVTALKQWLWDRHPTLMSTRSADAVADERSQTPVHHNAQCLGDPKLLRLLLRDYKRIVDPNQCDAEGRTPLHLLCMNADLLPGSHNGGRHRRALAILDLLLNDGEGDAGRPDHAGNTPLHYACLRYCGDPSLIEGLMRSHTRNPNHANKAGRTALQEHHSAGTPQGAVAALDAEGLRADLEALWQRCLETKTQVSVPTLLSHTPLMRNSQRPSGGGHAGVPAPQLTVTEEATGLPVRLAAERIDEEFARLDTDGSGRISYDEAKSLFTGYESFGVPMSDSEVASILGSLGVHRDGSLSKQQFAVLLLRLESR